MGKLRKRMSFSRIKEVKEMPNLIEVQKVSYQQLLDEGLLEVLHDISPIVDYNESMRLEFIGYTLEEPKNSVARCRERDMTYAAPLKVRVRLTFKDKGEMNIPFEFHAHQDEVTDYDVAPFNIVYLNAA